MRLFPCFVLLGACVLDNNLNGKNDNDPVFDSGEDPTIPVDTSTEPPPPDEECNGYDDDLDGQIDEGFPDDDANGRVDCLDEVCPALDLGVPGTLPILAECTGDTSGGGGEVTDPWDVQIKWQVTSPSSSPTSTNSYATAVIGNLDDDNGDGRIDEDDTPEVVANVFGGTSMVLVVDGATGAEKWTYPGTLSTAGVVVADVDADGSPDVLAYAQNGRPIAIDGTGTLKWTATQSPSSVSYPLISVADLDGDGVTEVIADDLILDGPSGSTLFSLGASTSNPYRIAAVADADRDGDQEIYMGGTAYDSDGTVLWTTGEVGTYGFWPFVVQADSDPEAEIGFIGRNYTLWEDDGTMIYRVSYGSTAQPGPPCVGDFDGDGESEVAWPAYQTFVMYELDGSPVWSVLMDDTSGLAGCSGWDVNGDGALEILFADQSTFKIFDGATGSTQYTNSNHRSGTVFEYPTVADTDHDGHAEIVITSNYWSGAWGVITAFEHAGDGWPAAGSTWAVHDFAITNINPDGSVPATPDPYWTEYNVYRARVAADDPSTPDLGIDIEDVCVMDCTYGPAKLSVQAWNQGGADVDAGTPMAIYAIDPTGERLIATYSLPAIPAGTKLEGVEFVLDPADVGSLGFLAVIDDDGTGRGEVNECDELNNSDDYRDALCP